MSKTIQTEKDMDEFIDKLPEKVARLALKEIATEWFLDEGIKHVGLAVNNFLDVDKPIDSGVIENVTQILTSRGIIPGGDL